MEPELEKCLTLLAFIFPYNISSRLDVAKAMRKESPNGKSGPRKMEELDLQRPSSWIEEAF
jgi:hypothetical protein